MSKQSSDFPSIPFSIAQPFQNVRLLEVPDEVLEIITNSDQAIYLKSSPPIEDDLVSTTPAKEGHLHLCSDEKTWLIKQVSTSNSVYITRTTSHQDKDSDHAMSSDVECNPSPAQTYSIEAISKPTTILELYPVPTNTHISIVQQHLDDLVPKLFSATTRPIPSSQYSFQSLHTHIPAPTLTIQRLLAQTCIIELPWSAQTLPTTSNASTYAPTAKLLLSTWYKIFETATLTSTPITGSLKADTLLDTSSGSSDNDDTADNIHKAVARRLFEPDGYFTALGLISKAKDLEEPNTLDQMETARWVGNLVLRVEHEQHARGMEKEAFEKVWEDAVPATWVKYCSVEVLGGSCEVSKDVRSGQDTILWKPFAVSSDDGSVVAMMHQQKQDVKTGSAGGSKDKRKWHEKFAAQRSAKR